MVKYAGTNRMGKSKLLKKNDALKVKTKVGAERCG